jgi:CubicO group peptidase (beta-lactamase class C family)
MHRLVTFAVLCVAASVSLAATQSALEKKVDAYFQPYVAWNDFSGTVLIARGDQVLVEKNYGRANFESNGPLQRDSRFHLASITKTFTAAAIEILAERGLLSYDDHLSKWAPSFPSSDAITVRYLLLHRSGVGNPDDAMELKRVPLREAVEALAKKPLWFAPGTSSGYSNGGYLLLAFIVEEVSGKSWKDFLRTEIFAPLKLTSIQSDSAAIVPLRVTGYAPGPGLPALMNVDSNMQGAIGSGSLHASARDLYRWGREVRNDRLVKRAALEYPYGWGVRKYFGHDAIEQSGLSPGFTSYLAVYPKDDLYVVVLSNIESGLFNHSGIDAAALVFGEKTWSDARPHASKSGNAGDRLAFTGKFTNPQIGTFVISDEGGELYLAWGDPRFRKYLTPVSPTALFNREEFSWIERDAARPDELTVRWGNEPQVFKRVDSSH